MRRCRPHCAQSHTPARNEQHKRTPANSSLLAPSPPLRPLDLFLSVNVSVAPAGGAVGVATSIATPHAPNSVCSTFVAHACVCACVRVYIALPRTYERNRSTTRYDWTIDRCCRARDYRNATARRRADPQTALRTASKYIERKRRSKQVLDDYTTISDSLTAARTTYVLAINTFVDLSVVVLSQNSVTINKFCCHKRSNAAYVFMIMAAFDEIV
jgi:hypothetical protein